jgi:GNAT superfamily N-acetyltransferase
VDARLTARALAAGELTQLAAIDRAEEIDGHYVVEHGALRYVAAPVHAPGWPPAAVDAHVARLHEVVAAGGLVVGAWDVRTLVGIAALDVRPVGGDARTMELDLLHVDRAHRGRGVARHLVAMLAVEARARGATALYVSATPTRNTVDAYLRLGAHLAPTPDPAHLAREPDDIHLLLPL